MPALEPTTLAGVTGGVYGDAVRQDPQYQRDLLACWDRAGGDKAAQAACVNTYYDRFWANRKWD